MSSLSIFAQDSTHSVIISVPDQCLVVLENGAPVARYPVSTSKYGLG